MALQGKARLSLFREGIEVHRVEKKNTITGYTQGLFKTGEGYYHDDVGNQDYYSSTGTGLKYLEIVEE